MEAALSSGFGYNSIESAVLDKLGQHHVSKHQLDYDSSYAGAADVLVHQLFFASNYV